MSIFTLKRVCVLVVMGAVLVTSASSEVASLERSGGIAHSGSESVSEGAVIASYMVEHLRVEHSRLVKVMVKAREVLDADAGKAGLAPTDEMVGLKREAESVLVAYPYLSSSEFVRSTAFGDNVHSDYVDGQKAGLSKLVDDFEVELLGKVEAYRVAVEAENARIAEAEAAAAAEAARQAAQAQGNNPIRRGTTGKQVNGNKGGGSGSSPGAPPIQETFDQRYWRLAQGISVPVPGYELVDKCNSSHPNAVGCYTLTRHYIKITHRAVAFPDCELRRIIAHEAYHYYQWVNGHYVFSEGTFGIVVNNDQIEADAYAYDKKYGC